MIALSPETFLTFAVLLVCLAAARFKFSWLSWWERPLARLARRKKLAIFLSAAAPLVLRAVLLPWYPAPEPRVHDEFTLLLSDVMQIEDFTPLAAEDASIMALRIVVFHERLLLSE